MHYLKQIFEFSSDYPELILHEFSDFRNHISNRESACKNFIINCTHGDSRGEYGALGKMECLSEEGEKYHSPLPCHMHAAVSSRRIMPLGCPRELILLLSAEKREEIHLSRECRAHGSGRHVTQKSFGRDSPSCIPVRNR